MTCIYIYISKQDLHNRPLHAGIHPREVGFRGVCSEGACEPVDLDSDICFIDTRYAGCKRGIFGSSNLEATEKTLGRILRWLFWLRIMIDCMVWANYANLIIHLTKYMISCFFLICATLHPHVRNMKYESWSMIHAHSFSQVFHFRMANRDHSIQPVELWLAVNVPSETTPYRVSVSIQLRVASSFKNAAYPSMIFLFPWWWNADEAWGKCRWDSSYLGLSQGESQGGANGWKQRRTHCSE